MTVTSGQVVSCSSRPRPAVKMSRMTNILLVGLKESCLNLLVEGNFTASALKSRISSQEGVDSSTFFLTYNGCPLEDFDVIEGSGDCATVVVRAYPVVRGGKGGFGSLIKAMGTQINKSNSKHACRDLSGRRMRDVKAEKKLAEWLKAEPERQRKVAEEKRKRLEKRRAEPRHHFNDPTYMNQIKSTEEGMHSALKQGLEASSSKMKRKQPATSEEASGSKKAKLWYGVDDSDSGSDAEEEGESSSSAGATALQQMLGSSDESSGSPGLGDGAGPSGLQNLPVADSSSSDGDEESNQTQNLTSTLHGTSSASAEESGTTKSQGSDVCRTKEINGDSPEVDQSCPSAESSVESQEKRLEEQPQPTINNPDEPIDLDCYSSPQQLESVGLERLKVALQAAGLKCGGTLQERAQRLFATKGKKLEELDPSMFAKGGKQRKRKNK